MGKRGSPGAIVLVWHGVDLARSIDMDKRSASDGTFGGRGWSVRLVWAWVAVILLGVGCGGGEDPAKPPAVAQPATDPAQLQEAADRGDARSQNELGSLLLRGEGVRRDYGKAFELFERASRQGLPAADHNLAMLYEAGRGTSVNLEKAAEHYRRAAEKGLAEAQYCLASAYAYGRGVPKDDVQCLKWLRAAAEGGDGLAQYSLGLRYQDAVGVAADPEEAWKWLELARRQETEGAAEAVETLARKLTREQMRSAKARASGFTPRPPPA